MHGHGQGGGQWGNGQPPGGPPHPGHPPHPGQPHQHPGQPPQQGYPPQQPGYPPQQPGYPPQQPGYPPQQPGYPPQQPGMGQQPYAGPPAQLTSGILVTAEFFFLQWILLMTHPVITVYNQQIPFKWNKPQIVPLPPGNHPINIHYPYIFQKGNPVDIVLPVHPGHVTDIKYSTSFFVFSKGNIDSRGFRPWGM